MVNRPFVVSPALTAIAIGYVNPTEYLIADRILPRRDVPAEKFKYLSYPLTEGFTVPDTLVGRKGSVNKVEFSGTELTGGVLDYGLGDILPYTDIKAAEDQRRLGLSLYDPQKHAVEWMTNLIELDRELRVAALLQNTATYAAARITALSGTAQFSDYTNSDPIGVISAAIDSTLVYRANTLAMGWPVWQKLRSHPKIVNAIKGNVTGQGIVTPEEVRDLFQVKDILIGASWVNTAKKGQNASIARVWGKNIMALYIDRAASPDRGVTFGLTAQYGQRIAGTIPDADIGLQGGVEVRVGERVAEVVLAKDVGALISGAVA